MEERQAPVNWPAIYRERRNQVRRAVTGGVILYLGHRPLPRNYRDNTYPFRQNSQFLYFTGLTQPSLAVLSYPEPDHDVLFAPPTSLDDVVWSGAGMSSRELARAAGLEQVEDIDQLSVHLARAGQAGLNVHYLPPFQEASQMWIAELLVTDPTVVHAGASRSLVEAVVKLRLRKSEPEVSEIEDALSVTDVMHRTAMAQTRPGRFEFEIAGAIQGIALCRNRQQAYTPIVTIRGEVLHNHSYENQMEEGQLLLNDSGSESPRHYASDITRTFPVGGKFTPKQADVYNSVLRTQLGAIEMMMPGVPYRDVHLHACRIMAEGMKEIGLMKGDPSDAVAAGAHALFFPHGLGHMLGLDVHDMEDLGDAVGYRKNESRSSQFGLNFLRLSRPLEPGHVLTVEPGIYFIPALIDRWQGERRCAEFIDYDRLQKYRDFGGIRIEDNVLVTDSGCRVLGPGIPKTIPEVESVMAAA